MPKDGIRQAYADLHPGESRGKVAAAVSQAAHFAHDMGKGITVVVYDPSSRLCHIGKVTGDCRPTPEADGIEYSRTVAWAKTASCDALAQSSKNSLGGIQTIFAISDEVMADLDRAAAGSAGRRRRRGRFRRGGPLRHLRRRHRAHQGPRAVA